MGNACLINSKGEHSLDVTCFKNDLLSNYNEILSNHSNMLITLKQQVKQTERVLSSSLDLLDKNQMEQIILYVNIIIGLFCVIMTVLAILMYLVISTDVPKYTVKPNSLKIESIISKEDEHVEENIYDEYETYIKF